MNKIGIGNIIMQSPPAQNDHKAVASTMKSELGNKTKVEDNFKSVFENVEQKEDIVNSDDAIVHGDDVDKDRTVLQDETVDELVEQFTNVEEAVNVEVPFVSLEQLIEEFSLPISLDENQNVEKVVDSEHIPSINVEVIDEEVHDEFLAQLQVVIQQLTSLMMKGETEEDFVQATKAIHKFLQLWGRLPQQMQQSLKENDFLLENIEEENDILRELITLFEKRNSFAKQQMYQTNSTISQDDVQKWLQQALSKHSLIDAERTYVNVETVQNQPLQMSTTQQYTLHVTESERVDAISRSLVSELSNIVNRSQFLKQPGLDELTLTLRPQSLGDVTVRLSQINGEMTVRFLVTTQAARELFESNLHQLKPMFAPNNVVIERDSGISDEEFYQEEQEQLEEEQQQEKEQQGSHDETSQPDVSFDELLQFLSEEANV